MALCGLTVARMRDGAVYSQKRSPQLLEKVPGSRTFYELAETTVPKEPRACESLDHLKSCALLAVLSVQDSDIRQMKFFLGIYHMFIQLEGMDQELNWPPDLTRVELEERRRLFWSMYMLEMFSAVCFDSTLVCREAHTTVLYPSEVDDEDLNDDANHSLTTTFPPYSIGPQTSPASSSTLEADGTPSWIVGWNFTIDLYRILEHALDRQKALALEECRLKARNLFHAHESSNGTVLDDIMTRYDSLPTQFKEIRNVTFNPREDRFGFEAANIAATIQLVRMTLFATEAATVLDRVQVVREVLQTFSEVPLAYLRAISTPLLHHLAGIGAFLGRALQGTLVEGEYEQIRLVLVDLAELLSALGDGSMSGDDPSHRLRTQIDKMDRLVEEQKMQMVSYHSSRSSQSQQLPALDGMDGLAGPAMGHQQEARPQSLTVYDSAGMPVTFPSNLLDEWSWAFDFAHLSR